MASFWKPVIFRKLLKKQNFKTFGNVVNRRRQFCGFTQWPTVFFSSWPCRLKQRFLFNSYKSWECSGAREPVVKKMGFEIKQNEGGTHCCKIPIFVQKIRFSIIPFLAGKFKFNVGSRFHQNWIFGQKLRFCISVREDNISSQNGQTLMSCNGGNYFNVCSLCPSFD